MAPLEGSRTDQILRRAFWDEGRFNRLYLTCPQAGHAGGHLDFLVAGYDTSAPSGSMVVELATALVTMTDDQTAMYAGMAHTAHDEGFEEMAGWFETLAEALTRPQDAACP
jgi:rubrerythrin